MTDQIKKTNQHSSTRSNQKTNSSMALLILSLLFVFLAACSSNRSDTSTNPVEANGESPSIPGEQEVQSSQPQLLFQVNSFSPDKGKQRDLYLVNSDGSGLQQLTQEAFTLWGGEWSPDGQYILFHSNKPITSGSAKIEVNPGVYVMKADGSDIRLLTQNLKNQYYFSSWHPDSRQILFTAMVPLEGNKIFKINVDGTGEIQLKDGINWAPRWSPDGEQIVFAQGDTELAVIDSEGSQVKILAKDLISQANGRWSPDGAWVYFTGRFSGQDTREIFRIKSDGSEIENLTNQDGDDMLVGWSPDGSKLLVISTRDGNQEVYVMDADGANPVNMSQNPAKDHDAAWSPDGNQIAFVSDRSGEEQIYVMNADGSNVVQVSSGITGTAIAPKWKPVK